MHNEIYTSSPWAVTLSWRERKLGGNISGDEKCLGWPIIRENVRGDVRIPVQDYKSLRAEVVICATLVNTQTHIHFQTSGKGYPSCFLPTSFPVLSQEGDRFR